MSTEQQLYHMEILRKYECNSYFRENGDTNCVCDKATHNGWEFGRRSDVDIDNGQYYDGWTRIHKEAFEDNNFENCDSDNDTEKDQTHSYFVGCNCLYCEIASNMINDKYEQCFCCDKKIYNPEQHIMHCYDCNSVLCHKCCLHGRYLDEEEYFCFNCRRFSEHKNAQYYFPNYKLFYMHDDWMNASWYY